MSMHGEWRFRAGLAPVEKLIVEYPTRDGRWNCRFRRPSSTVDTLMTIGAADLEAWANQGIIQRVDDDPNVVVHYQCPPGHEYAWVADREYFEDADERVTVTVRRLRIVSEHEIEWIPPGTLCEECGGDEVIASPQGHAVEGDIPCPTCLKDPGLHPAAATWVTL